MYVTRTMGMEWYEKRYKNIKYLPQDKQRIAALVAMVGFSKKVLDIGCGSGEIGALLLNQNNKVFGVDNSKWCVKKASKKGITVKHCDIQKDRIPFTRKFDVVMAAEILEHVVDTDRFLKKVSKRIKEDGELILSTPNVASLGRRLMLFFGKNPHLEVGLDKKAAGHVRYFTKKSLFTLLRRNGFEIVDFSTDRVNFNSLGSVYSILLGKIFPTLGSTLIVRCKKTKISKKILVVANSIPAKSPGVSGGESRFIELARVWESLGYEIHLMSSTGGKNICKKMELHVTLHKLSILGKDTRWEIILRTLLLPFHVAKLLKNFDGDIVYSASEQIYDVLPGAVLKILSKGRIKHGVVVHWLPPLLFWTRKGSTFLNSLLFLISERLGLLLGVYFADALFPVSKSTFDSMKKAQLVKLDKTYVVSCGVRFDFIRNISKKVTKKKYDAVFMKRVQSVKGIFDLIDIWERVVEVFPEALLGIIGDGIDGPEAKRIVKEKKLDKNIKFLGAIFDFEKKFGTVSSARLFLHPSYEENWSIVVGEALACGVPVVAYDLSELREVWKKSLIYTSLGDKKEFTQKVIELLKDKSKRGRLSDRGLKYVKRYNWEKIAEEELAFLLK